MEEIKIGIVVADPGEYCPFRDYYLELGASEHEKYGKKYTEYSREYGNKRLTVIVALSGVGKTNAASQTAFLICDGCKVIFNFGFSGGISGVTRKDFVLCEKFLEHDFDLTMIGYKPCQKPNQESYIFYPDKEYYNMFKEVLPNAIGGCAVTGDTFISDKNRSEYLKNSFGATTCDMETAAIASVCFFAGAPFVSLRRVSDDASDEAPEAYLDMNSSNDMSFAEIFSKIFDRILGVN